MWEDFTYYCRKPANLFVIVNLPFWLTDWVNRTGIHRVREPLRLQLSFSQRNRETGRSPTWLHLRSEIHRKVNSQYVTRVDILWEEEKLSATGLSRHARFWTSPCYNKREGTSLLWNHGDLPHHMIMGTCQIVKWITTFVAKHAPVLLLHANTNEICCFFFNISL